MAFALCYTGSIANAQTKATDAQYFDIELNSIKDIKNNCRMTLVMRNGLGVKVENITLNLVLFDTNGSVAHSMSFNAGRFNKNKTHVYQFDLKSLSCKKIQRVLINDLSECKGKALTPDFCLENLKTHSAIPIPLIQ